MEEAHDNSFRFSGWLVKWPLDRKRGSHQRSFFLLTNEGKMVYYENVEKFQEDEARIKKSGDVKVRKFQKGQVDLNGFTTISRYAISEGGKNLNVLRLHNGEHELLFQGESEANEEEWIARINDLICQLRDQG